jgi:hypothetical protein
MYVTKIKIYTELFVQGDFNLFPESRARRYKILAWAKQVCQT